MNPKNYNGLRGSGLQVPIGSQMDQDERAKLAIMQQMQGMSRDLYLRAAAQWIAEGPDGTSHGDFRWMAERCQSAARDYFIGIGVIQEQPQTPDADE
jgi:hypothetical protein